MPPLSQLSAEPLLRPRPRLAPARSDGVLVCARVRVRVRGGGCISAARPLWSTRRTRAAHTTLTTAMTVATPWPESELCNDRDALTIKHATTPSPHSFTTLHQYVSLLLEGSEASYHRSSIMAQAGGAMIAQPTRGPSPSPRYRHGSHQQVVALASSRACSFTTFLYK